MISRRIAGPVNNVWKSRPFVVDGTSNISDVFWIMRTVKEEVKSSKLWSNMLSLHMDLTGVRLLSTNGAAITAL